MKAVVVDIIGKHAVVLNKNGEFIKIKNTNNLRVGFETDIPEKIKLYSLVKTAAVAAVFIFTLSIGYGAYSYSKPYSYITVDINPSMELTTNRYDRIIDAKGLNDDGKALLSLHNLKNKNIKDGIENILKDAAEKGYFKQSSDNAVMFTVSGKNDEKVSKIKSKIQQTALEELNTKDTDVLVEKVPLLRHEAAEEQGISPGKMLLIEKLIKENPQLKVEDLKDAPVKEIVKSINKAKKANDPKQKGNNSGEKSNNGDKGNQKDNNGVGNNGGKQKDDNNGNKNSSNNSSKNSDKNNGKGDTSKGNGVNKGHAKGNNKNKK